MGFVREQFSRKNTMHERPRVHWCSPRQTRDVEKKMHLRILMSRPVYAHVRTDGSRDWVATTIHRIYKLHKLAEVARQSSFETDLWLSSIYNCVLKYNERRRSHSLECAPVVPCTIPCLRARQNASVC